MALLAGGALIGGGLAAAQPAASPAQPGPPTAEAPAASSAVDAAWAYYHQTLDAARAKVLAHPFADTPLR
ncbi:MAG: hypothetical protein JO303_08545, partial [Caulobacteraceae bacterium]|nr:hypothetical protein [Caulobacteraceae bacterium]